MTHLFLTILCTVFLFLIFRYLKKFGIDSFHAVVINYYVCIVTGVLFLEEYPATDEFSGNWIPLGIITGSLFAPTFYLMSYTVEKVSVSVATVANKMSLILPVIVSYFYLKKDPDHFSLYKILGFTLAIVSIYFTSQKKDNLENKGSIALKTLILPFSLFVLGGTIDSLIGYANYAYLHGNKQSVYPLLMFATAAFTGTIAVCVKMVLMKKFISGRDVLGGVIVGIPNYFSLHFLLRALSDFTNDAALVYTVFNISVIILATFAAVLLFREKLSPLNLAGICLSAVALLLLFW